jgi:hypothetical protein
MADRFTDPNGYTGTRSKGKRMGTLWIQPEIIEADVTLSPLFDELDDLERLDALQDVIGLLQREYDATYKRFYGPSEEEAK